MGSTAVDRFYQLTFAHENDFRKWTERIVEFTAGEVLWKCGGKGGTS